jgi:hypothetical protein
LVISDPSDTNRDDERERSEDFSQVFFSWIRFSTRSFLRFSNNSKYTFKFLMPPCWN